MQEFRSFLKQEFARRVGKNPAYSLRAFASALDVHHSTLSSILSGKRTLTKETFAKFSKALALSPDQVRSFEQAAMSASGEAQHSYYLLQQDAFNAMSEWYYDAILELSLIPWFQLEPTLIAAAIGISSLQAEAAIETLERLKLLVRDSRGQLKLHHQHSTNILDPDFTTAAQIKYQASILRKSAEALETVDRKQRDHTSTTIAIEKADLPEVKKLIQKFRNDLTGYLQRPRSEPDSVYQLQVSFFPLTTRDKKAAL